MTPLHIGELLDHYRIDRVAARSGMASIFRATDVGSGLQVAIKVPHPEMERDSVLFDRFLREAQIGQEMDHPGVTKVLNSKSSNNTYIAMEWLEGRLLSQILRERKKLPAERAVQLTVAICNALDYIHARGVIHRDLKHENIMVDSQDCIKLMDFGIAARDGERRITFGKPSAMGTPDYISPEQASGNRGDARSDLYALGVMLYEMLTGKTPFRGKNALAVMNDRLQNNPIPPREINREISPQLQEIIYRALERDPKKRYASARTFAFELEHLETVVPADRAELREWKWRRTPLIKKLLFYSLLALIPAIVFSLLLGVGSHSPHKVQGGRVSMRPR